MIYITFKGIEYEVPYDIQTLKVNRTIDSSFDNGYFESAPLEALGTLDVSRKIPRNLPVRIVYDGREFYFKTGETFAEPLNYGTNKRYKHMVNLVSLSKDLTRKPSENITVTQPKGDFGQYSRSVNVILDSDKILDNDTGTRVWDENTLSYTVVPLANTVNSNLSKIDGLEIISAEEYTLNLNIDAWNKDVIAVSQSVLYRIKYGTTVIKDGSIVISRAQLLRPRLKQESIVFKYTPTATGTLSVELQTTTSQVVIQNVGFSITAIEVVDKPIRTYAQVIDKVLNRSEYVLSPESRSRLNLTAPEDKYEEYTLYDILSKIGGYVGALVRVGGKITERVWRARGTTTEDFSGDSLYDFSPYEYDLGTVIKIGLRYYENIETSRERSEIIYEFFDSPNVFDAVGVARISEQAELDDYVSAIELNTKNIIKPIRYSPFRNGWKGLRNIDGIGQFTTSNIGYETEDKIERAVQVRVKGFASRNATNTVVYTTNSITDITERVLEKTQWDTLPSEADYTYTGKQELLKNNTLYYIKGDNKIYGMSYVGEAESTLIGQPNVNRALYETILAVRSVESGELITHTGTQSEDDPEQTGDLAIEMQVVYSNFTESRARLYKDDQSGFDTELIKYFNESSNVNESEAIGNYAQQIVNRLGGTKHYIKGVVDSLDDIAELGDIDSQGRVYTIIELWLGRRIKYAYTLVQDYNIISSYIGIQSRHRVEEISQDSTTNRTLRYTSKFIFTDEEKTFTTRLVKSEDILKSLLSETSAGLTYGYLECNLSNGETKKLHLSIDSDSKGKTIEIKWGLPSNFSAGLKRYSITRGSDTIWLNLDVPYTDYYGKVNDILFSIYYDNAGAYDTDDYPEATTVDGTDLFTVITDVIDKDAGEVLHGLVEIPILSETDKIRVYNGFARWNKIVEGKDTIRACGLNYIPVKNTNKIDLSRVEDITVSGTATFGKLGLTFNTTKQYQGVAFYEVNTLDLLLVYIDTIPSGANSLNMFYRVEDSIYGGGQNITTQLRNNAEIGFSVSATSHEGVSVSLGFEITQSLVEGDDYAITVEGDLGINFTVNATSHQGQSITYAFSVDSAVVEGDDYHVTIDDEASISFQVSAEARQGVNVTLNLSVAQQTRVLDYVWMSGGYIPTPSQTCSISSDEGNVRCDATPISCDWIETDAYFSATDESMNVGGSCFIDNSTKIECTYDAFFDQWACTEFTAYVEYSYSNCETCTEVVETL